MNADLLLAVQAVTTLMAMGSLICRAGRMTTATPATVRHQHGALFAGLAVSLVLPPLAGKVALTLGILVWLALAAPRWRHGVPAELHAQAQPPKLD